MQLRTENISPLPFEIISFLEKLILNEKIERIIVFGSRAIGDYEDYSDFDIAIDAPKISKYEWLKIKEYSIYDLRTIYRVSLVNYSTNPDNLKESINQKGKTIYGRH